VTHARAPHRHQTDTRSEPINQRRHRSATPQSLTLGYLVADAMPVDARRTPRQRYSTPHRSTAARRCVYIISMLQLVRILGHIGLDVDGLRPPNNRSKPLLFQGANESWWYKTIARTLPTKINPEYAHSGPTCRETVRRPRARGRGQRKDKQQLPERQSTFTYADDRREVPARQAQVWRKSPIATGHGMRTPKTCSRSANGLVDGPPARRPSP